jgi:hypothetical protein
MPEWSDNILVVTKEEIVPRFWRTYYSLNKSINRHRNKPYGVKQVQRGCYNRRSLISFDSLPFNIQEQLGDPRKNDHILERYYQIDHEAVQFYTSHQYPDGSYLKDDTQEQYIINASVLKALQQLQADRYADRINKGGKTKDVKRTLFNDAHSFNDTLYNKHQVAHNLPGNYRRFMERWSAFNERSYIALVKDASKSSAVNAKKVDERTVKLLNDLFATQPHKPTATEISFQFDAFINGELEVICNETGEVYDPATFPKLSDSTVKRYLRQWENRIHTHARRSGNRQQLASQYRPYHSLGQPTYAGSILSIDDRQPPFEYAFGKRLWFYNAIDLASEAFTCWVYGETKEGLILNFYRQLVRNYTEWGLNLPWELECETALNSQFTDTFLRNGAMFQNVRMEANNARGKRIEAYYRPLRYQLEKKREGWLARPFSASEANQAGPQSKTIIDYQKIINGSLKDIQTWNNMEHSKAKGVSRWEYFITNQNPHLPATNWRAILLYIGYHRKSSCKAGIIKLQYGEFLLGEGNKVAVGDDLIRLMKQVEGASVDIYWLDGNDGQVLKALIYKDGRYICEAVPKPVYNRAQVEQTPADEQARQIMSSYVATIDGFMQRQKSDLNDVTILDNRSQTVSNSFKMPGLEEDKVDDDEEAESLGNECEAVPVEQQGEGDGRSWRDKFKI